MTALAIGAPQIIYIGITALGLGITMAKHGEPQPAYSIWRSLFALPVGLGLLYWGGFFSA